MNTRGEPLINPTHTCGEGISSWVPSEDGTEVSAGGDNVVVGEECEAAAQPGVQRAEGGLRPKPWLRTCGDILPEFVAPGV